jgi:uncharacterized membrane protein YhaH (DUF805 family)
MEMINYYKMAFAKYATFSGRSRRSEYWYFFLFNLILSFALGIVDGIIGTNNFASGNGLLGLIYSLATIVPSLAVGVRRMHDQGKSGWFILIPIYNIVLFATDGNKGTNEYGPDPKNPEYTVEDHLID